MPGDEEKKQTLTKARIVERVHNYLFHLGLRRIDSVNIVESIFEIMKQALEREGKVLISRFGTFEVREKKERRGRNPKTGESIILPGRKVVTFKYSSKLRKKIEKGTRFSNHVFHTDLPKKTGSEE